MKLPMQRVQESGRNLHGSRYDDQRRCVADGSGRNHQAAGDRQKKARKEGMKRVNENL